MLLTSEADVSATKIELSTLKAQTTGWEVEVAQLNADLASKFPKFSKFFLSGITNMPTLLSTSLIFSFAGIFPGFVAAADNAIMLEQAKRGAPADSTNLDMADQLVALGARKANIQSTLKIFSTALCQHTKPFGWDNILPMIRQTSALI
jgi:hypothetical protein